MFDFIVIAISWFVNKDKTNLVVKQKQKKIKIFFRSEGMEGLAFLMTMTQFLEKEINKHNEHQLHKKSTQAVSLVIYGLQVSVDHYFLVVNRIFPSVDRSDFN
jgi:hypothetical protein